MTRAVIILDRPAALLQAAAWLRKAPKGTRLTFQAPKRSLPQSARMWAHLTDIARQTDWHGQRLSTEDWKRLFMAALDSELRLVPNLAGNGFVALGRSSSDLSVGEMTDLIALMEAFCAERGIALGSDLSDQPKQLAGAAA